MMIRLKRYIVTQPLEIGPGLAFSSLLVPGFTRPSHVITARPEFKADFEGRLWSGCAVASQSRKACHATQRALSLLKGLLLRGFEWFGFLSLIVVCVQLHCHVCEFYPFNYGFASQVLSSGSKGPSV